MESTILLYSFMTGLSHRSPEQSKGAVGLAVNILRNLLLLKVKEWPWVKSKITLSALLALLIWTTALTWDGWISLLPFISISVTCVGYWTDSAKHIRLSQLLGSPWTGVLITYK